MSAVTVTVNIAALRFLVKKGDKLHSFKTQIIVQYRSPACCRWVFDNAPSQDQIRSSSIFSYQTSAGDALELYSHTGMRQALIGPVTETDNGGSGRSANCYEVAIEKA